MAFRFARVSREQARAAAELAAAREIQRHLVPAVLPSLPSYAIEAAYLPAREVGGDLAVSHRDAASTPAKNE